MAKTVAVLKGGWSSEREVSLSSGAECAKALRQKGYDVKEIDVKRDLMDLVRQLSPAPDAVFNALHGTWGEDGCVQGVLEIMGIPYTHSGPLASALAMNKQKAKEVLKPLGVPCPEGELLHIDDIRKGKVPFKQPYVVKPNNEGSSVGVYIVRQGDNKPPLGLDKWAYGPYALVEKYIPGRELSVGVMGKRGEKPRALTVTEISTNLDFYNYEAKYAAGGSVHTVPAAISREVFDEALRIAAFAHENLGCTGVTRSDFRYNDNEPGVSGLFYLETNTQPGMTPTSLVPEQALHMGMSFGDLVEWLVENAAVHT
ncbi:MAG: D-alanine--D-alanine ligase [Alphaproteobacteria bacterium]|jgi:D-alanine-D-alanine ligase|nr:D-alanine--D-alanine ligase [Alphaproteobacteria bacterium]